MVVGKECEVHGVLGVKIKDIVLCLYNNEEDP